MGWFVINQCRELQGSRVPQQGLHKEMSTGWDKGRPESTAIILLCPALSSQGDAHIPFLPWLQPSTEQNRPRARKANSSLAKSLFGSDIQKRRQASATVTGSVSEWGHLLNVKSQLFFFFFFYWQYNSKVNSRLYLIFNTSAQFRNDILFESCQKSKVWLISKYTHVTQWRVMVPYTCPNPSHASRYTTVIFLFVESGVCFLYHWTCWPSVSSPRY